MSDPDDIRVRCACGWETTGPTDDVVERTREHGLRLHNMAATNDQILAMATPATEDSEHDPRSRTATP